MPKLGVESVRRHDRPSGKKSRLWSVRTQLLAPILMATIGLVVLGTAQTNTALSTSSDANRARVLAGTATATVQLVHELERELAETVALRQRGGQSGRELVNAQRKRVDLAVKRYRTTRDAARETAPNLAPVLDQADSQLTQLQPARAAALSTDHNDDTYAKVVEALLGIADALPTQLLNTELANTAREVAAVVAQEHIAALERDLLREVFSRGSLHRGELARLAQLNGARSERQAEFSRIASRSAWETYKHLVDGQDVTNAQKMREGALKADIDPAGLKTDADSWYVAQSGAIRRYNMVSWELSRHLDQLASDLAAQAQRSALLAGGSTILVVLVVLVTAVVLAVRTSRRLHRLRQAALRMAEHELPTRITAISSGEEAPEDEQSASVLAAGIAQGGDEIGQVAEAFDSVNRTALRLASEQAELRVDITRMAEALARRIRTLITRQLRLLDEFEREETDPDALARFFALDHLAARLRRNGENLLVLAGGEPGRPHEGNVMLNEIVIAAASEIEDYTRVEYEVPDVVISGAVVGTMVHLLAELLENATAYSPPNTMVRVDGRHTVEGLVIRVQDQGIGISESRLEEINKRLSSPANLSSAAAGSMGLHVVSHLAARHHIGVRLHSTGGGTTAHLELPESAVVSSEAAKIPPRLSRPNQMPPRPSPPSPIWFEPSNVSAPSQMSWTTAYPGHRPVSAEIVNPAGTVALPVVGSGNDAEQLRSVRGRASVPGSVSSADLVPASPAHPSGYTSANPTHPGAFGPAGVPHYPIPPASTESFNGFVPANASNEYPSSNPVAAFAPAGSNPSSVGSPGGGPLPRRARGHQLMAELQNPQPTRPSGDLLDPEVVRNRLSALAEGVATAMRNTQYTRPSGRDQ